MTRHSAAARILLALTIAPALHASDDPPARAIARRIIEAADDGLAYEKLAYLSDRIGHRLSGSEALERAVQWTAREFERDGADTVRTEPVMVPRWVRGEESAGIVEPVESAIALLALGGSVGTPEDGITAPVVEARDFEELEALGDRVRGRIVLFNKAIEPGFGSSRGYGSAVGLRVHGASRAAKLGAVGMLIRSLGTADFRLPHTGAMSYEEGVPKIPAAAISAEDAEMIRRLLASGDTVKVHLRLGCRTLADVPSANVVAELRGRERPDEIVLIGAHLDTWDVGQGAHDDGAGCAVVMETMRLLRRLDLIPRRTVRAVLFTNEENGLRGGRAYAEKHGAEMHVVAIESDSGGGAPTGFGVTAGAGGVEMVRRIARHLAAIGADEVVDRGGGADISPLRDLGVPVMNLRQDSSRYFHYHHSAADTLDKVDRGDLNRNVAALAFVTYMLAERPGVLPGPEPKTD